MARRVHFTVEKLSEAGRATVHRGLRRNWTYRKLLAELKRRTGEKVSHSALGRYAARRSVELKSLQETQEQAKGIIAELVAGNLKAGDVATALLTQALADTKDALKQADPVAISYAQTARERLDLKREEIELRKQEMAFNERKFEAMEQKLAGVKEKAAAAKERVALNPAEAARQIDELYGLTQN